MPLVTGTRFRPYEILARIGKGGTGEGWKATVDLARDGKRAPGIFDAGESKPETHLRRAAAR